MAPKDRQERADASDEAADARATPTPDEDGPHDVPDDKVIERTLPSTPVRPGGGSGVQ